MVKPRKPTGPELDHPQRIFGRCAELLETQLLFASAWPRTVPLLMGQGMKPPSSHGSEVKLVTASSYGDT